MGTGCPWYSIRIHVGFARRGVRRVWYGVGWGCAVRLRVFWALSKTRKNAETCEHGSELRMLYVHTTTRTSALYSSLSLA